VLIGHYAPALLLNRARPTVKLWHLFVATQFVDVLWAIFVLTGVEHARIVPGFTASNDLDLWDMPYSHSLAAAAIWALFTFVAWAFVSKAPSRAGDAAVLAVAVASHFAADFIVHAGDLPVFAAQGPKLGLGLWQHRELALVVEVAAFAAAGLWWWLPRAAQSSSRPVAAVLAGLTVLAAASFYIPTPPSPPAMAVAGLATYAACTALAAWAERKLPSQPDKS
jgi:hypothetical protein